MSGLLLGFGSSVAWGCADFLGGLKSRKLPLLNVLLGSQLAGLAIITVVVAVHAADPPAARFLAFAALSGMAGVVGLAAFYRGLAVGNMAVVAPISSTAAVIPLVFGIAAGDRPTSVQAAGLALALAGVVLASREEVGGGRAGTGVARGAGLALVSAVGFGLFFVAMDGASDGDPFWAIFVNRLTAVAILGVAALALRPPLAAGRRDAATLALVGVLDITANSLYAVAATKGLLSLVAVLGSLYPLTTIALARVVLGERPHRVAQAGVVAALAGVALVAAG
jgi:drug/metabolite transporter (DMT)-like permease